jgi:pSer/pThr/pTyr-binding forkhead associated (FHA) protein
LRLKPDNNTIGRDPRNDIVIAQNLPGWDTVSPQHARIYRQDGRWILEDLDSMNGVYVNGQRTGRNLLHEGYRIGIGGVDFIFHLTSEPASQENEYAMS